MELTQFKLGASTNDECAANGKIYPPPACFGMSVKGRKESLDYRLKAYNPDGGSRKGIPAVEFVAEQIADGDKNFNIIGLATGADAVTWKDGTEDERERLKDRAFNSYQQGSTRK